MSIAPWAEEIHAPDGTVCGSVLASTENGALPKRKQATIIAVPALRFGLRQCGRTRVVLRPLFLSITPHWAALPSNFVNLKPDCCHCLPIVTSGIIPSVIHSQ